MNILEEGTSLEQRMFDKAKLNRIPIYGIMELLPLCNMNCDMCYVRMSKEEVEKKGRLLTVDEWRNVAHQMKKAGTLFVLLTGGEPLLYPGFKQLYLELKKMGLIVTINSNATLINEEWADFFKENPPRRMNITLYGGSNETYESLCHIKNGYDKATRGIRLLYDRGISIRLGGSLAKKNREDRYDILAFGESLDIPVRIDNYMYPTVRERSHAYNLQSRMNPEEAAQSRVEVLRREQGEEYFRQYRKMKLDIFNNTDETTCDSLKMNCSAGKCSYTINWQGELRSCVVMNEPAISMLEEPLEEGWQKLVQGIEQIEIAKECGYCKYRRVCNNCAASAIAETGRYDGVPDYICRYTKETIRIYQEMEENES